MLEGQPYKTLAIHSQSDRPGTPYQFEGDQKEKAYATRALTLPNLDSVGVSKPIEPAYSTYLTRVLQVSIPNIIVPGPGPSLSHSFLNDSAARAQIKQRQQEVGVPFALSVFDVTDSEKRLLEVLDKEIQVFPEVNFGQAVLLGDKAGFREFCTTHGIPQFDGQVVRTKRAIKEFLAAHPKTIIKHPVGTAGEGLTIITEQKQPTPEDFLQWDTWIESRNGKGIIAEIFEPGGIEYAQHIYIDPITKKTEIRIYQQLVTKNEDGSLSHYGAIYPIADPVARIQLEQVGTQRLIPALQAVDYTGPASLDVLYNPALPQPFHFMENNARIGANGYIHRMAGQVGESLYGNPNVAFMSLVSLPHEVKSFEELSRRFTDALTPKENGTLIFTNPGRHEFGYYDVTAISPYGVKESEKILFEGISQIWGVEKAREFFDKIHKRS